MRADRRSITPVAGVNAAPDFERRVAERRLQVHDDEEEHPAEAGVDGERDEVRAAELPRAEEVEGEHRGRGAVAR